MFVHHICSDWRQAGVGKLDRALLEYAEKLTKTPQVMGPADLDVLRAAGANDQIIHDATQVICYFNYINRIADALGVEPEEFVHPWEQRSPS